MSWGRGAKAFSYCGHWWINQLHLADVVHHSSFLLHPDKEDTSKKQPQVSFLNQLGWDGLLVASQALRIILMRFFQLDPG